MISAEELLKPIADDNPCGEDLSYDPAFQELDVLMKGKPETQFSSAEPPDWAKVAKLKQKQLADYIRAAGLPDAKSGAILARIMDLNFERVNERMDLLERDLADMKDAIRNAAEGNLPNS